MHSDLLTGTESSKSQVTYQLPVGDQLLPLNDLLGRQLSMHYQGEIHCCHCGRKTKKSFNQGFCYPCFKKLPQCDSCIMSPEKCHYDQGTCRDPAWGEKFCMTDHVVYLANSSGLKVGITRATQVPTRWIDQGATQAMPFIRVATRQQSGLLEVIFKEFINDRTNWRAMLKGPADPLELQDTARELLEMNGSRITALQEQFGIQAIQPLAGVTSAENAPSAVLNIDYPVIEYPAKVTSRSFDKEPLIEGTLLGIKGQYLILDNGVVNIRKHTAYQVSVAVN
ncbi:DUF2797 domain-containing protein [Endozoicomonas sp. SCSIO W0465]|uniref:DUF2797 domain-containing protein n=1 Tax=Endozoicomonas sp. SCSIO W0465 TaxID=2918516 RepID=UPI0020760D1A|nr:DUF2797 domain-containing protein [Endozoicomonas sp. SCSIO W0465]USE38859.1 DUF2797 domain-containing protein [Endozoicomonas sp. SCSIO W0465]